MSVQYTAERIADRLAGLDFITADIIIDDARRIVWLALLEHREFIDVATDLRVSRLALEIAAQFGELTRAELNEAIGVVRNHIWTIAYLRRPDALADSPSKAAAPH